MKRRNWMYVLGFLIALILMATSTPLLGQGDGSLIDDFEDGDFASHWWSYGDENTVSLECVLDQPGYQSNYALHLTFDISAGGHSECGTGFDMPQDAVGGLSFFWRADQPGLALIIIAEMDDPTQTHPDLGGVTQFNSYPSAPGSEWTAVTLRLSDFTKATWFGDSGVDTLDFASLVGFMIQVENQQRGSIWIDDLQWLPASTDVAPPSTSVSAPAVEISDKFALWGEGGPYLRGANIWQRHVYPELDYDVLGPGPIGPPLTQDDFNRMAAMGANYVNISHAGLFTENPPYVVYEGSRDNLDHLLEMIAIADMFAVISFRTGPGRSEFTFNFGEEGEGWFDASYYNEAVWQEQAVQDAWVEMWRYTAERYRDNPIVVGYDLMVEPNDNDVLLSIYDPDEFYPRYAGTLYDWNTFYPRIVEGVRAVDTQTPILVGPMGWSGVDWLSHLQPADDPRIVYMTHQYAPGNFTYQWPPANVSYPGSFDTNWDGVPEQVNRDWLDALLTETIDVYAAEHGVRVGVNEFGVVRWVPGGAQFMDDLMSLFEERGINYALWEFHASWQPFQTNDAFDFQHGPDPNNHANVGSSELIEVIRAYWSRNTVRPSNVGDLFD